MSRSRIILLVEDNPDDVELTLRAFERSKVIKDIVVARDGAEAPEYLFATGAHAGLRGDERTRRLPVVVLTSSNEEGDVLRSYDLGANSFVRKPVDFAQFLEAAQQLGLYWLVVNEPPPTGTMTDRGLSSQR
ncbi:MAG: response regulator [Acidobacteria bacterium]|nr:response regulator [Acidobacteriota bacterium]